MPRTVGVTNRRSRVRLSSPFYTKSACSRIIEFVYEGFSFGKNVSSDLAFFSKVFQEVRCIFEDFLCTEGLSHTIELACRITASIGMKCRKRLPLLLGERDSANWYGM